MFIEFNEAEITAIVKRYYQEYENREVTLRVASDLREYPLKNTDYTLKIVECLNILGYEKEGIEVLDNEKLELILSTILELHHFELQGFAFIKATDTWRNEIIPKFGGIKENVIHKTKNLNKNQK